MSAPTTFDEHYRLISAEAASTIFHGSFIGAGLGAFLAIEDHMASRGAGGRLVPHLAVRAARSSLWVALLVGSFTVTKGATELAFGPKATLIRDGTAGFVGGACGRCLR